MEERRGAQGRGLEKSTDTRAHGGRHGQRWMHMQMQAGIGENTQR